MASMIEFARPDGQQAPGYLAEPEGAARGGVVVLQEWWGLLSPKSHITATCEILAGAGYRALAPDLYRGKQTTDAAEAEKLLGGLDFGSAVVDIRGALQYLKQGGQKAAVLGFCMGGALTLLTAMHAPEIDAAVCFYGIPPAAAGDPASIKVPVLGHFATKDGWCNTAAVDGLAERLAAGKVDHRIHRYEADHAFGNHLRPEVYDAAASQLALARSLNFLQKHIG